MRRNAPSAAAFGAVICAAVSAFCLTSCARVPDPTGDWELTYTWTDGDESCAGALAAAGTETVDEVTFRPGTAVGEPCDGLPNDGVHIYDSRCGLRRHCIDDVCTSEAEADRAEVELDGGDDHWVMTGFGGDSALEGNARQTGAHETGAFSAAANIAIEMFPLVEAGHSAWFGSLELEDDRLKGSIEGRWELDARLGLGYCEDDGACSGGRVCFDGVCHEPGERPEPCFAGAARVAGKRR